MTRLRALVVMSWIAAVGGPVSAADDVAERLGGATFTAARVVVLRAEVDALRAKNDSLSGKNDELLKAAEALHITLTSREFGRGVRVPLAGIPYHALNSYLSRLLTRGFKVAIAEQVSEPGRGIVDRAVVRVITPGTIAQPELLHAGENCYLAAVCRCVSRC